MTKTHPYVTVPNYEETFHCEVTAEQALTEARLGAVLFVHDHTVRFKVTPVSAVESLEGCWSLV